jgi:hypothetical protein
VTPQERLAEAMVAGVPAQYGRVAGSPSHWSREDADAILAADAVLAQDIADGQALRLLREALPDGVVMRLENLLPDTPTEPGCLWSMDMERDDGSDEVGPLFDVTFDSPTIAEAADACRAALEARA